MINTTFLIVIVMVVAIWILIELKRFKHKLFAVFVIVLILGTYLGFMTALKGQDVDLTTFEGIKTAGQLYYSWLGTVFTNIKSITANAIKMDWKGNHDLEILENTTNPSKV